jgi:hypothetical protein
VSGHAFRSVGGPAVRREQPERDPEEFRYSFQACKRPTLPQVEQVTERLPRYGEKSIHLLLSMDGIRQSRSYRQWAGRSRPGRRIRGDGSTGEGVGGKGARSSVRPAGPRGLNTNSQAPAGVGTRPCRSTAPKGTITDRLPRYGGAINPFFSICGWKKAEPELPEMGLDGDGPGATGLDRRRPAGPRAFHGPGRCRNGTILAERGDWEAAPYPSGKEVGGGAGSVDTSAAGFDSWRASGRLRRF